MFIRNICNYHVVPVDAEHLAVHEYRHLELLSVGRLCRLLLAELCIPLRENDRDYRCSVVERIVVERDRVALHALTVECSEHLVEKLPAPLTGEDEVAVFHPAARLVHDLDCLVESHFEVGLPGDQWIIRTYDGACPRMDGDYTVILCDLTGKSIYLILLCVAVRFVHESERASECAALHGLTHMCELLLDLLRCIRRRIISCHSCTDRALSDQRDHVHKQVAFRALLEFSKAARRLGVEETAADLVPERCVRIDAERREAAVACYLCRDSLLDERLIVLLRILIVIEEIIV